MTERFDAFDDDPVTVARRLLGQRLVRIVRGHRFAGTIVEVEAYLGAIDRAAHTYGGRRTPRNESMYLGGGHAYVYFTYGKHYCVNVVCGPAGGGTAVLLRAIEPTEGLAAMGCRRIRARRETDLCSGPAKLTQAFDIDRALDGAGGRAHSHASPAEPEHRDRSADRRRLRRRMGPRAAPVLGPGQPACIAAPRIGHGRLAAAETPRHGAPQRSGRFSMVRAVEADIIVAARFQNLRVRMSIQEEQQLDWRELLRSAGPYPLEAFSFVQEGLSYTAGHVHGDIETLSELDRHVSGQQLCLGLRDFAIRQYGLLAPIVLEHWKIRRTEDFGRIVFSMIDAGLMSRTDGDTMESFRGIFDFGEAFCKEELMAYFNN